MQANQAVSANGNRQNMGREPDPQVRPKAERRQFSVEYKRRILAEADGCSQLQADFALVATVETARS